MTGDDENIWDLGFRLSNTSYKVKRKPEQSVKAWSDDPNGQFCYNKPGMGSSWLWNNPSTALLAHFEYCTSSRCPLRPVVKGDWGRTWSQNPKMPNSQNVRQNADRFQPLAQSQRYATSSGLLCRTAHTGCIRYGHWPHPLSDWLVE